MSMGKHSGSVGRSTVGALVGLGLAAALAACGQTAHSKTAATAEDLCRPTANPSLCQAAYAAKGAGQDLGEACGRYDGDDISACQAGWRIRQTGATSSTDSKAFCSIHGVKNRDACRFGFK